MRRVEAQRAEAEARAPSAGALARSAAEAESRAELAAAREREAELIADAASAILAGHSLPARMQKVAGLIATATGAGTARMALETAPSAHEGERAIRLPSSAQPGWLYVPSDCRFSQAELERIAGPLGRLIEEVPRSATSRWCEPTPGVG
jgi:hypothetical protein